MAQKKLADRYFEIGQEVVLDHTLKITEKTVGDDGITQCTCQLILKDGQTREITLPSHALVSDEMPMGGLG